MNLAELVAAYKSGQVTKPLMIDNDHVSVWPEDDNATEPTYEAHPVQLLEDALDLLGIPHEHV